MEPRQKDEQHRCESDKPRRFKIDKLEERIAPDACDVLSGLLDDGLAPGNPGRQGISTAIGASPC